MFNNLTRRQLITASGGLLLGTAAAITFAKLAESSFKRPRRSIRAYGVVLTNADVNLLKDCVLRGGYNTIKVVTAWGLKEGWNPNTRRLVCNMTPNTIVLTEVGNGVEKDAFPYPNIVVDQIKPWYEVKQNIIIEIGNEPNGNVWGRNRRNSDFVKKWREYFQEAVASCRRNFPQAKLISSGMASLGIHKEDIHRWFDIAGDVMRTCDYIGFHVYVKTNWYNQDTGFPDIISAMNKYFSDKPWALTEYAIEDAKINPYLKGLRYADFVHFGKSNPHLPNNVRIATYFHLDMNPESTLRNFLIYPTGDDIYRTRIRRKS
jgi:hypothetical protein